MEMALPSPRGAAFVTLVIDAIHGMVAAPHDIDRALSRLDFGLTLTVARQAPGESSMT